MTAVERVLAAYRAIEAADRPEIWIHLRSEPEALAEAEAVDRRTDAPPLRGTVLAVKDNVDVAGMPTTVLCEATSLVTTALAPTFAPSPTSIGPSTCAPEPITTPDRKVGCRLPATPVEGFVPPRVTFW